MEFVTSFFVSAGLWILGAIYELVSYAYSVFILMCSLNFSVLEGMVSSLIDSIEALVMVFVAFKVGVALIQYMLEPEKAMKDGTKLVVNILITAVLLISRNFVFGVFNELGMLIMGNPTGYPYTVLSSVANVTGTKDEGLIMRLVFDKQEKEDIGKYLAFSTVSLFVHDYDSPETSTTMRTTISTKDGYNFMKLPDLVPEVNRKVKYVPIIGSCVGIFLIFSLVKSAIEMGIRMFKLLILQMLAPVAIITCVGDGLKSSTFQSFYKKYISVWIEAFTRMLVMLITVVFVSKFFLNIGEFFGNLTDVSNLFTKSLITILVVVAAFKFASDVPKFIDEVLGTKMASDSKGGFGKFVGGLVGGGIGLATGLATGTLAGTVAGLAGGISSGSKGKNIADFFKGAAQNSTNAKNVGANARLAGGSLAYAGAKTQGFFGRPQRLAEEGKLASERQTAMDNMIKDLEDYYDGKITIGEGADAQEIGLTRDLYKNYAYDQNSDFYKDLKDGSDVKEAVDKTNTAYNAYASAYNDYQQKSARGNASEDEWKNVEALRTAYQSLKSNSDSKLDTEFNSIMIRDAKAGKNIKSKGLNTVQESIATYDNVASKGYKTSDFEAGRSNTKKAKDEYTRQQDVTTHSHTVSRWNNTQSRGGK